MTYPCDAEFQWCLTHVEQVFHVYCYLLCLFILFDVAIDLKVFSLLYSNCDCWKDNVAGFYVLMFGLGLLCSV